MDINEYSEKVVARTCSGKFHGDSIHSENVMTSLQDSIDALKELDQIKKCLFYGKKNFPTPSNHLDTFSADAEIHMLPEKTRQDNIDLIHGIIGIATEAGELLEWLYQALYIRGETALYNVGEELGDSMWYFTLTLRALGTDFEKVLKTNKAKLESRYPEKFTENLAETRDLEKEKEILKNNLQV